MICLFSRLDFWMQNQSKSYREMVSKRACFQKNCFMPVKSPHRRPKRPPQDALRRPGPPPRQPQGVPKTSQGSPKTPPRRLQDAP